jgi:hypothetical protein
MAWLSVILLLALLSVSRIPQIEYGTADAGEKNSPSCNSTPRLAAIPEQKAGAL